MCKFRVLTRIWTSRTNKVPRLTVATEKATEGYLATYKLVIRLGMRLAAARQRQADPLEGPNPGARKGNPWGNTGP